MNHKNYYTETKKLSEKEQVHLPHTFLQRFKCFAHLVLYCIDGDMQPYGYFFIFHTIPLGQQEHLLAFSGKASIAVQIRASS